MKENKRIETIMQGWKVKEEWSQVGVRVNGSRDKQLNWFRGGERNGKTLSWKITSSR